MLQDDAMTMPDPREKGPVILAPMPMKTFVKSRPGQDTPSGRVSLWYQQAGSVVRFIKRGHIEGLFTGFCENIRDGADLETALRDVYGYSNLDAFEQAWLKWRPKSAKGMPVGLGEQ